MSAPARKPLSPAARKAIAIRKSVARSAAIRKSVARAANDNKAAMPARLLADCVAAGGFEQHAAR